MGQKKDKELVDFAAALSMKTLTDIANEDFNKNWTLVEDRGIYDGWCAKVHNVTGEIVWREEWFTKRISLQERKKWELQLIKSNPEMFPFKPGFIPDKYKSE